MDTHVEDPMDGTQYVLVERESGKDDGGWRPVRGQGAAVRSTTAFWEALFVGDVAWVNFGFGHANRTRRMSASAARRWLERKRVAGFEPVPRAHWSRHETHLIGALIELPYIPAERYAEVAYLRPLDRLPPVDVGHYFFQSWLRSEQFQDAVPEDDAALLSLYLERWQGPARGWPVLNKDREVLFHIASTDALAFFRTFPDACWDIDAGGERPGQ